MQCLWSKTHNKTRHILKKSLYHSSFCPKIQHLLGLCLLWSFLAYPVMGLAQARPHWVYGLKWGIGPMIPDKVLTPHLTEATPWTITGKILRQTAGAKAWEQAYGLPRYGLMLAYTDFQTEALGQGLSMTYTGDFVIYRGRKQAIHTELGMGLGWVSNPYRRVGNHKNLMTGSSLNAVSISTLSYHYRLDSQWEASLSIGLRHFSNGATQLPNWGINVVQLGAGLQYRPKPSEETNASLGAAEKTLPYWYQELYSAAAWTEQYPTEGDKYPVWNLHWIVARRLNEKLAWHSGLDWMYNERFLFYQEDFQQSRHSPWRVSITQGIDVVMGRFSTTIALGLYIYKPQPFDSRLYQRFGWKYYWHKRWFGLFALRTQGGSVDNLEFGMGYRLGAVSF